MLPAARASPSELGIEARASARPAEMLPRVESNVTSAPFGSKPSSMTADSWFVVIGTVRSVPGAVMRTRSLRSIFANEPVLISGLSITFHVVSHAG